MSELIGTIKELKEELYSAISDMSKEANGVRTRYNYMECTVEKLMSDYDYWHRASEATYIREQEAQADNKADFEERLSQLIGAGAGDRSNAFRWMLQAEGADLFHDLEHFFWGLNLSWDTNREYCAEFAHLEEYNFQLQEENRLTEAA